MKIGDILFLTGQWRHSDEEFHYRCKIIDMEKQFIYIDYPVDVETKRTIFFPLDESFNVNFINDNAVYQFKSKAIERTRKVMPVLKIAQPDKEDIKKIQRRAYVRVETTIDAAIHCPEDSFSPFTTITKDISGGGALFYLPKTIECLASEQPLLIYLVLHFSSGDYVYLNIEAEVVRVINELSPNTFSVSFNHEQLQTEQILVQYCFDIQRQQRQRKR